jgi:hypothetical protein
MDTSYPVVHFPTAAIAKTRLVLTIQRGAEMTLHQKIESFKQQFLENVPEEKVALMNKATQELSQSGILSNIRGEGEIAPNFSLEDGTGTTVHLADLKQQGHVVLTFYRGVW